jgi:hypothetical protein
VKEQIMAIDNCTPGKTGGNPDISTITGIEPVHVCVRAEHDLNAVELNVADGSGSGFSVLLSPDHACDLVARLSGAISLLAGSSDVARLAEGQRLLRVLKEAAGWSQRTIARKMGVADSIVSLWVTGREPPAPGRLAELGCLVKRALRND